MTKLDLGNIGTINIHHNGMDLTYQAITEPNVIFRIPKIRESECLDIEIRDLADLTNFIAILEQCRSRYIGSYMAGYMEVK